LGVESILVPRLSSDISSTLKQTIEFTSNVVGIAHTPSKDTILNAVNKRNVDVDYSIQLDDDVITNNTNELATINSQMDRATGQLVISKIQKPNSFEEITPNPSSFNFVVKQSTTNKTLQIDTPYVYVDGKNNEVVTNITNATLIISYPYISYNTATASYLQTNLGGELLTVKDSYADIVYRNLRTFSGYVARHKIYRKSLLSNADYQIIADETIAPNELLRDALTQNKFYERLGKFYNKSHISRYWFTSSLALTMSHTPLEHINSVKIDTSDYSELNGNVYVIVKNDSVNDNRDAIYIQYDSSSFANTSGSSYDSNFISLRGDVDHLFEINGILEKSENEEDARLEFYFTSSLSGATKEPTFTTKHGIYLGAIVFREKGLTRKNFQYERFYFNPIEDLYGTLVIVPYRCKTQLWDLSLRVFGDDGFSPDVYVSRVPWPITVANESYDIKAELFDINHNLIYSDLKTIQDFDSEGESLIPYVPEGGSIFEPGTNNAFISGSLTISQSLFVENGDAVISLGDVVVDVGNFYAPFMTKCNYVTPGDITGSRMVTNRVFSGGGADGLLCRTPLIEITHNDQHIFVTTGSNNYVTSPSTSDPVLTKKSIAAEYSSTKGRKIYWILDTRYIEE
jgi:hypothetical protein